MQRTILALTVCLWLVGCALTRPPPAVDVDLDYHATRHPVATYTLVIDSMPGFLAAYARDALVAALTLRGATEVAADGDVEFRLSYEQVALSEEAPGRHPDDFGEPVSTDERERFLARLVLAGRPSSAASSERIGALSRVHVVTIGAYMHDRARSAITTGFDRLLDGYIAR